MKKILISVLITFSLAIALSVNGFTVGNFYESEQSFGAAPVLRVQQGGTGAASFTAGECLVGNGTGAITTTSCGTGSFSGTLNDISDVSTTTTSFGDLLMWQGSYWTNTATSALGLPFYTDAQVWAILSATTSLPNLTDVGTISQLDFTNATGTNMDINQICFNSGQCMTSPTNVGSAVELFHWNASSSVAGYEMLRIVPDSMDINTDESCSADADVGGGYCLIDSYVSTTTDLALTSIPAGSWGFHYYSYVDSTAGDSKLEARVYKRASNGDETLLFTATSTDVNSTSIVEKQFTSVQSEFAFATTDRIVVKVYGWTDQTNAKAIHFLYGGNTTNYSHIETPITLGNFNFARLDENEIVTGDWTFTHLTVSYASSTGITAGTFWGNLVGNVTGTISSLTGTLGQVPYFSDTNIAVGTTSIFIDTNGNVGIGTTTPSSKLTIYNGDLLLTDGAVRTFKIKPDDNGMALFRYGEVSDFRGGFFKYDGSINTMSIGVHDAFDSNEANDNDVIFIPRATGYIGIATATPAYPLDVYGNTRIDGTCTANSFVGNLTGTASGNITVASTSLGNVTSLPNLPVYASFTWPAVATTTTATTSFELGAAMASETWNSASCWVSSGTGAYEFSDGTNKMNYITASTTVGQYTLSTNNTFTANEKRYVNIGALTAAKLSCTIRKILQ